MKRQKYLFSSCKQNFFSLQIEIYPLQNAKSRFYFNLKLLVQLFYILFCKKHFRL